MMNFDVKNDHENRPMSDTEKIAKEHEESKRNCDGHEHPLCELKSSVDEIENAPRNAKEALEGPEIDAMCGGHIQPNFGVQATPAPSKMHANQS